MTELFVPWSLQFHRDGAEDYGVISDRDGDEIVTSRHFWLPERNDPIPPALVALRVMKAAPKLLDAIRETLKEIEHWHADMLTPEERNHPRGNGWARVYDKCQAALAEADGNPSVA